MNEEPSLWLDDRAASAALGIDLRELYRLIDEGTLPAYQWDGVIRLQRSEVDAYAARASAKRANDPPA